MEIPSQVQYCKIYRDYGHYLKYPQTRTERHTVRTISESYCALLTQPTKQQMYTLMCLCDQPRGLVVRASGY